MQQTEKYKLNLIEKEDVFSPDALNENMEKVEGALDAQAAAEAAARAAGDAALDQRVQVLELHRFLAGTYADCESGQIIELPFTPVAVLLDIVNTHDPRPALAVTGRPTSVLEIVPGGFKVRSGGTYDSYTSACGTHSFIAFF